MDKAQRLRICQFQSAPSPPMTAERAARCQGELVVVTSAGEELGGARAVFFALRGTSLGWFAAWWSLPPFIWLASFVYRRIARNRGWISQKFFKADACGLENRFPEVD